MDTTQRRTRQLLLAGAARAHGANLDYACALCGFQDGDHDDDGRCPDAQTFYERRSPSAGTPIPVRTDATLSGDDSAGSDDHNRRV